MSPEPDLRYNQFHTTALCSPTRAALLTGRNHHSAHMGTICEIAYGFPGYDSVIPQSTATLAQVLRMNGYSTALFGKAHFTPTWEIGPAGPFDRWPTGLGFERFYGFLGGDTSQYEPALYDQTTPVEPYLGRDDYHLSEDLADKAIDWIRLQKTSAPDKPFFLYFAPGATHSPHQVWPEWSERFAGQFDDGWDALREQIYARQIEMGIIPSGARLTPRPEQIPAWADYDDRYKPVARRLMEVYAGFLAHTDAQIGRVIDAIDELGQWDNTLFIYVCGDNGASAEGTMHGAWSSPAFQNGLPEDPEWLLDHMADFGTAALREPLQRRLGLGARRTVSVDEAGGVTFRGNPQRTRHLVAAGYQGGGGAAQPVPSRHRHRAHDPRCHRDRDARARQRRRAEADRRRQHAVLVRRRRRGQPANHPVFRDLRQSRCVPRGLDGVVLPWATALDPYPEQYPVRRYRALGALPPRRRLQPGCRPRRAIPRQARRVEGRFRR